MCLGQYSLGDIQYRNYTCVNSGTCMYWKAGKVFAQDPATPHIDGATAYSDTALTGSGGGLSMHGPSGAFSFVMRNVSFIGQQSGFGIGAGQHCGIIGYNYGT